MIQGTLVREGPCLYVERNEYRTFPVFPTRDADFDEDENVLTVAGVRTKVGEEVSFGGSGRPLAESSLEWASRPDESCDTEVVWLVGL